MLTWPGVPSRRLLPEPSSASPPALSVLTLYSESVASEYGHFMAFLHDLLGDGAELCGTALAFSDLQKAPELLAQSEGSDVVVLITGDEELSAELRRWLAGWLQQAHADSAVICLLADGIYRESATWHGVHRACDEAGVAFFATGFKSGAASGICIPKPLQPATKTYSPGILHWGINE